jgi:hypothetical protein
MYTPLLLQVALLASAAPPIGIEPEVASALEMSFEASPRLAAKARLLAETDPRPLVLMARRLGLESPGPAIRVQLVDESSPAAAATEPWIHAWAYGSLATVVLLAEREPGYPDGSLEELLRHEVAHVLIYRAAAGHDVPRWFNEGVALELSRPWGLEDRSRLSLALLLNERIPITALDRKFAGGRGEVQRAYALSGALVREIVRAFERAFFRATGVEVSGFEAGFWRRYSLWYRWLPLVTSSLALWLVIVLLALWAGAVRRRRRAALEAAWSEDTESDPPIN